MIFVDRPCVGRGSRFDAADHAADLVVVAFAPTEACDLRLADLHSPHLRLATPYRAGYLVSICVNAADSDTLLLYTFEGTSSSVADIAGTHQGKLVGGGAARVSGQIGCGNALRFDGTGSYLTIADSPAWDLAIGSVDLWLRFTNTAGAEEGIVSRDALANAKPGHLLVLRLCDGRILARVQGTSNEGIRCSAPVPHKRWAHVGINFGSPGLELYVDGVPATFKGPVSCPERVWQCGSTFAKGIVGNDNPWVLGGSSGTSGEGQATPVIKPMRGKIDSLRISRVRRSF